MIRLFLFCDDKWYGRIDKVARIIGKLYRWVEIEMSYIVLVIWGWFIVNLNFSVIDINVNIGTSWVERYRNVVGEYGWVESGNKVECRLNIGRRMSVGCLVDMMWWDRNGYEK